MNIVALFNALPGACAICARSGELWRSAYLSFCKILDLADLTVDGTMCTGGAVCIVMMINGHSVGFSLFCAFVVCWLVWQRVFSIQQWESRCNSGWNFNSARFIFHQFKNYGQQVQHSDQHR